MIMDVIDKAKLHLEFKPDAFKKVTEQNPGGQNDTDTKNNTNHK